MYFHFYRRTIKCLMDLGKSDLINFFRHGSNQLMQINYPTPNKSTSQEIISVVFLIISLILYSLDGDRRRFL